MRSFKAFITIFFILCLIPALLTVAFPSEAAANELLASAPGLNASLLEDSASWFNDHFALRQQLITAWSAINSALFRSSAEEQVVLGEGGELYYARDFADPLTAGQLESIAEKLLALQQEIEKSGSSFIFTIAPDKSGIYSPELPPGYSPNGNAAALKPWLEKYGVNYVDLTLLFSAGDGLYYETDSHWNSKGAAAACDALIGTDYFSGEFISSGLHKGDLYEMLYPALQGGEEELSYAAGFSYECLSNPNAGNAIKIETRCEEGSGSLFCWRDSFGVNLYPYLAQSFETALFSRSTDYSAEKCSGYDVVILEIVERNLETLSSIDNGQLTIDNSELHSFLPDAGFLPGEQRATSNEQRETSEEELQAASSKLQGDGGNEEKRETDYVDYDALERLAQKLLYKDTGTMISKLGQPLETRQERSAIGEGYDIVYIYEYMKIQTYKEGATETITAVTVYEDGEEHVFPE